MRCAIFVGLILTICSISAYAQTARTITNLDLEKYKESRVAAEKQLREDYAKLGFRSPEERAKSDAADAQALTALSERLRAERVSREQAAAASEAWAAYYRGAAAQNGSIVYVPQQSGLYYGYVYYGGHWRFNNIRRTYQQPGYFAGGNFWATGNATRPRPLFVTPRPRH
ncbi:MAG: hypothetical protein UZ17_ACD001002075 [Acidobacteria bacterium OLB17]|nr:MAG: hypothetical protein UZ17_ACD001002075 [Acidobacteria bacterium OLB17]MCZ2389896.1 hypothetical protein [Acidobacteriota bacterium]